MQLLEGFGSLGQVSQGGGVAFFAHIGGFLGGLLLVSVLGGPRNRTGGFTRRGHAQSRSWEH
jgi:membrane associated rhomboid family serine protease